MVAPQDHLRYSLRRPISSSGYKLTANDDVHVSVLETSYLQIKAESSLQTVLCRKTNNNNNKQ